MMDLQTMRMPSEVVFGSGAAETIGDHVRRLSSGRALLVSDAGLVSAGLVDQMVSWLTSTGIGVEKFVNVEPEPSINTARECLSFSRKSDIKVVIGMGGGSVMDVAKTVAALLGNDGDLEDYLGADKLPHPGYPAILIPTTAGTGSELGLGALFFIPERRAKEAVFSRYLQAKVAIIDPVLTLSTPPSPTAASGLDALCHAIESFTGRNAHPLADTFAAEAIRLISTHLRTAVLDGQNLRAREGMMLGVFNASVALSLVNTNAVHALAYPLQGLNRIPHGIANALLLPHVMAYVLPANLEKFARVAECLGQPIRTLSLREAALSGVRLVNELAQDVKIPTQLSAMEINLTDLQPYIQGALNVSRLLKNSPRRLDADDIASIFLSAQ